MTCPYEIQLLNLSASTALVATHRQLGLIGWLLAEWRWSGEKTVLVLDEGQHIVQEALSMVRDSISLKTIAKAATEAERYGFRDRSERLKEAVEYYGVILPGLWSALQAAGRAIRGSGRQRRRLPDRR
jgi:hypothetical protein